MGEGLGLSLWWREGIDQFILLRGHEGRMGARRNVHIGGQ